MANEIIVVVKEVMEGNFNSVHTALEKIGDVARRSTEKVNSAFSQATNVLSSFSKVLAGVAIGAPIVAGSLTMIAPALLAIVGLAGAATSALFGVGIALATLKIGFGGIGEALTAHGKQMAGAGKAAANTAEQEHQAALRIRDASRNLTEAKKREAEAAKEVNEARRDEVERLQDLKIALQNQKVSQAEAFQALTEAKEKNRRAQEAGSAWEKAQAKNALDRAQAEYDEQSEKLDDLTKEKQKADKLGIEGSDQVQKALHRQTEAHEEVKRAQEQLTEAQRKQTIASAGASGGINAFSEAMNKLSPNAKKLVYALIAIEERFKKIKFMVQDRLLEGFDKEVTDLADKWLPHLDDILGNMADHLNKFGKTTMHALGDSDFIKNVEKMGKDFGLVIDDMGVAVDAVIDAFGRLGAASGPVLRVISGRIKDAFVWFDKWIKRADDTGQLDTFMQKAADALDRIFVTTGLVLKVIGQFIAIIFPSAENAASSIFDKVDAALRKISAWLADPKNQKRITEFLDSVGDIVRMFVALDRTLGRLTKSTGGFFGFIREWGRATVKQFSDAGNAIKNSFTNAINWLYKVGYNFFSWIGRAAFGLGNGLYGMWAGLRNGFRDALNWVIGKWNNLSFPLPSFLGGGSIETPNVNYLARGGIAGGMALVGERGRELVRLPQGSSVIPNGTTERMLSGGGGGDYTFTFAKNGNKLMDAIIDGIQMYVKNRGGNVQVALGKGVRL